MHFRVGVARCGPNPPSFLNNSFLRDTYHLLLPGNTTSGNILILRIFLGFISCGWLFPSAKINTRIRKMCRNSKSTPLSTTFYHRLVRVYLPGLYCMSVRPFLLSFFLSFICPSLPLSFCSSCSPSVQQHTFDSQVTAARRDKWGDILWGQDAGRQTDRQTSCGRKEGIVDWLVEREVGYSGRWSVGTKKVPMVYL